MISFYDIPSHLPINAWSPNTWKTRYCLNYKGIPYKTEWVEYPDIEDLCKKSGIPPTSTKKDGRPHYTLPAIHDPSTGSFISDSLLIAEYLDKTYPDTPKLFPAGTKASQLAFIDAYEASSASSLREFILPVVATRLNPRSEEYFRRTRAEMFGKNLEDVLPTGKDAEKKWSNFKAGLDTIDGYLRQTDDIGPFVLGDVISFTDFFLAGYLVWMKIIWGENSKEWGDIRRWNNSRWEAFLEILKKYETVDGHNY